MRRSQDHDGSVSFAVAPYSVVAPIPVKKKSVIELGTINEHTEDADADLDVARTESSTTLLPGPVPSLTPTESEAFWSSHDQESLESLERDMDYLLSDDFVDTTEDYDQTVPKEDPVTFWLLAITHFCLLMDQHLVVPHLTDIADAFHMNAVEKDKNIGGKLQLILMTSSLPFLFLVNVYTNHINRKFLYIAITCAVALGDCLVLLVQEFWHLEILRAVSSLQLASWSLILWMINDMFAVEKRAAKISVIGAAASLGLGVGQVVSTHFGDKKGWKTPFVIVGVVNFTVILLFAVWAKEPRKMKSSENFENIVGLARKLMNRGNILLFSQSTFQTIPNVMIAVWMTDFMFVDLHAGSKMEAFCVLGFFGVGILTGQLLTPYIFQKLSVVLSCSKFIRIQILVSMAYLAPMLPILIVINSEQFSFTFIAAFFFTGCCVGVNDIMTSVAAVEMNPGNSQYAVFNVYSVCDAIGKGFGAVIVSEIATVLGRRIGFSCVVTFWAAAGFMFSLI